MRLMLAKATAAEKEIAVTVNVIISRNNTSVCDMKYKKEANR